MRLKIERAAGSEYGASRTLDRIRGTRGFTFDPSDFYLHFDPSDLLRKVSGWDAESAGSVRAGVIASVSVCSLPSPISGVIYAEG